MVDILRDINITDYKPSTADTKKIRSEASRDLQRGEDGDGYSV